MKYSLCKKGGYLFVFAALLAPLTLPSPAQARLARICGPAENWENYVEQWCRENPTAITDCVLMLMPTCRATQNTFDAVCTVINVCTTDAVTVTPISVTPNGPGNTFEPPTWDDPFTR